jgi:hypothetical protein
VPFLVIAEHCTDLPLLSFVVFVVSGFALSLELFCFVGDVLVTLEDGLQTLQGVYPFAMASDKLIE